MDRTEWNDLAAQLAIDSIRSSTAAGSGHPTSSLSAAHLLAVLWADHLRYDVGDPKSLANDRFVLSKGHASPLLYSMLKAVGTISDRELMTFRRFGSPVQGHPVPLDDMPWIDVATGSLGQGLPIGLGMALAMKLDDSPARVWVLLGDSEMAEGSVWEAMENASFHGTGGLKAILDMNRLGQRGPTMLQWNGPAYVERARAFGWDAFEVDGHDVEAIDRAYRRAEESDLPTLVVARTVKGQGVSFLADKEGWHGKPLSEDQAKEAIAELGGERRITITPPKPDPWSPIDPTRGRADLPAYTDGIATRKAFGEALRALGAARTDVVALDGEVSNSTYTEDLAAVAPDRFLELFIAEQAMLGAAVGLQALGKVPFAATFGAFLTRAHDFIRMGAIGRANLRLCGSHAGVSIGEDGPSQMALEDLAMFRAVHGSTVLYPSDGNSTSALTGAMAELRGVSYLRTTREKTAALYGADEAFPVGGSKVIAGGDDDRVTLVGAGITVHECIAAAALLTDDGIIARVIDCYSIKPLDAETVRAALRDTGMLVVVEDHWIEGGLGDAVLDAIAAGDELRGRVVKIAVTQMPGSGSPEELRGQAGISASRIAERVRQELVRVG
jgi:transketolase